jgi:hypothetical protein
VLKYTQKEGVRENPRKVEDRSSLAFYIFKGITREIGGGWPLLTVETEVSGDSKRTNERGPYGLFIGLVVAVQKIFVLS